MATKKQITKIVKQWLSRHGDIAVACVIGFACGLAIASQAPKQGYLVQDIMQMRSRVTSSPVQRIWPTVVTRPPHIDRPIFWITQSSSSYSSYSSSSPKTIPVINAASPVTHMRPIQGPLRGATATPSTTAPEQHAAAPSPPKAPSRAEGIPSREQ